MARNISRTRIAAALAIAILVAAPLVLGTYPRYVISLWLIFGLSAVGLNIPIGLASIYSFGHGGFMLIGAYATAIAMASWGWPLPAAFLLSLVLASLVGALIGLPSLRLTGFSLAIVTFAFGFMLFSLVKAFEFTGGPQGIFVPDTALAKAWDGRLTYYLVLAIFLLGVFGAYSLSTAKTGRALRTLGSNAIVAQSLGVNLLKTKITAFVLSAVYGAASGSLLAFVTTFVAPESYASELSVNIFAAVIIGGAGTLVGPILGALFIVVVPELTQAAQNLSEMIYAIVFCIVATLFPRGLMGLVQMVADRFGRRASPAGTRA